MKKLFAGITARGVLLNAVGSLILAFGLCNIHACSGVSEGGALGLSLLLRYWWGISPAVSGAVIACLCYFVGIRAMGRPFLIYSAIAVGAYSGFYRLFECFAPVWPLIADLPLLAAVLGAVFVGIGVGLCVRGGGAPTGDDALAMSLSRRLHINIAWIYFITDSSVLAASFSYLPPVRVGYSLLSVVISGQLVALVARREKNCMN